MSSLKLCMAITCFEVYIFVPILMTLIEFQGHTHSSISYSILKVAFLSSCQIKISWCKHDAKHFISLTKVRFVKTEVF